MLEDRDLYDAMTLHHAKDYVRQRHFEFVEWNLLGVMASLLRRSDMDVGVDLRHALQRLVRKDASGRYRLQRRKHLRSLIDSTGDLLRTSAVRSFLNTLDHAMSYLDEASPVRGRLPDALYRHLEMETTEPYQDEYFKIHWYANGNVRLLLRRSDLVEKANRIFDSLSGRHTESGECIKPMKPTQGQGI
ncbi:hypothetical protein BJI67_16495 (plasmid) [Acidihalobacter aeolianus]|uniref:DUF4942 domain-containing protein n=2 Tax=Acidihalobacter aeolianus TaxID=2792603 RepID=A0A1D8KCZ9_9GAMM|nr:hypothetical protein BJI67_16495 [Acidihalobacter aeolianus]